MMGYDWRPVVFWCPPSVSKGRQVESALEALKLGPVNFHSHGHDEKCPGFQSEQHPNNCWMAEGSTT